MKCTLNHPLYRRPLPTNEVAPLGYVDAGCAIEIEDAVVGKTIDGDSVWYRGDDGVYYWSGGFAHTDFLLPEKDFYALSPEAQYLLTSEAMNSVYAYYANKLPDLTGMSVTFKETGNRYQEWYALVFQVALKTAAPQAGIPGFISYKGFGIPTDVVAASATTAATLGGTLSRTGSANKGSAGFIVQEEGSSVKYLVTNYHVACDDLLRRQPPVKALAKNDSLKDADMLIPAFGANGALVVGKVVRGVLDSLSDIALIQLPESTALLNSVRQIGSFTEIITLEELRQGFAPGDITVKMFGAASNRVTEGAIISLHAKQPVGYLGGAFTHTLGGLIQTERISVKGDSGSAVFTVANKLVGVLVADDDKNSYIIPVETVLSNFSLKRSL